MNGYEIMADSYRQMVKQGRIDKETADKEIRIYDFLSTCDTEDICRMVDSSAFNDIIKRLSKRLLKMQILTKIQGKKWLPSSVICSMKRRQDRFSMADKARKCKVAVCCMGSNSHRQVYFLKNIRNRKLHVDNYQNIHSEYLERS